MINVTRLSGEKIVINADLIERVEATPDSVIALTNGSHYVVRESVTELVELIVQFKARVLRVTYEMDKDGEGQPDLHLVHHPEEV